MLQINQYLTVLALPGVRSAPGPGWVGWAVELPREGPQRWFSALFSCHPLISGILPVGTPKVSGFLVTFILPCTRPAGIYRGVGFIKELT